MTIDKFGGHISNKYSDKNGYYLCYLPLHVQDSAEVFGMQDYTKVLTYKINELTNTWTYPLAQAVVKTCRVFHSEIKFVLNNKLVESLDGETLTKSDTILVVRSENSLKTGNGIIELVLRVPISVDEYE